MPDSSLLGRRSSDDADCSKAIEVLAKTRSEDYRGLRDEISTDISERLNQLHLPVENEPTTLPNAHSGSWVESTISNSQITPGRDMSMISYNGAAAENVKKAPERGDHIIDEDDIASGMLIPAPPACILERDAQHTQIIDKLVSTNNARVAILGMGGIGKTTLACSVANDSQIIDAYSRRLFLSFEGCSTGDLAYTHLATAFQTPVDRRSSQSQILSHILNCLRQQKTLLIIDNFETFWEVPSNRRAAEDFLSHLAALRELAMIVTLRGIQRPGNVRWVKIDPLRTLTPDASKELFAIITDEEYAEGDFEFIQRLLDAVAGIPLAVTLIGTLLRDESETPRSLWNQWTRESARSIRVANEVDSDDRLYRLDISLRLSIFSPRMSDNAKEMLAAVALLPTGLNMDEEWLDELQRLLPSTVRIRDCIRTLRDVALVTLDQSTSPHRLRLLSPVRDFCLNNLPLHGEVLLRLIDRYNADLVGYWDFGSSKAYTWVTMELSNIAAILNHAIIIPHITDNLASAVHYYTEWRRFLGMPDTAIIEQAIVVLSELPTAKALCLQGFGTTLFEFNRREEAMKPLKEALFIHRELGNKEEVGWDLYLIGVTHSKLGDDAAAERCVVEAIDLFTEVDNNWMRGSALDLIAETYIKQEKYSQTESIAKEALELCLSSGNRKGEINALTKLAIAHREQGKYDLADEYATAARDASQATHDTYGEARANEGLGYISRIRNKPDQAKLYFRLALSLFERCQSEDGMNDVRVALKELEASSNFSSEQSLCSF